MTNEFGLPTNRKGPYRFAILGAMLTAPLMVVSAGVLQTAEQKADQPSLALRVLVPGKPSEEPELTPMIRAALESVGASVDPVAPSRWADLTPDDADAILLSQTAVPHLGQATAGEIAALEHAVARGIHLIVVGAAARALPDSRTYARMIGRSPSSGAWTAERTTPSEVGVFVGRQDHSITQCVTHLVFGRAVITAVLGGDQILARAVRTVDATDPEFSRGQDAGRPGNVFGIHQQPGHLGLVVFLALETEWPRAAKGGEVKWEGPRKSEREILATLIGRTMEWLGKRQVTLHLPVELPLAASRLGPDDTGLLPGVKPVRGFYRGRQIARFMTFHGADWLVRPDRELTERPDAVLDSLKLKPGSTVVDLGAGVGYFTGRMARRVGPRGKVLAVDIQEEMLEMLIRRMDAAGIKNVVPVLATAEDPRLPSNRVDLVLMVDVYHELSDPSPVIAHVRDALRQGGPGQKPGRLVLVEYRGEDPTIGIKPLHRMTVQQARAELEPVGFRWVETKSFLPQQRVIIFERAEDPKASARE